MNEARRTRESNPDKGAAHGGSNAFGIERTAAVTGKGRAHRRRIAVGLAGAAAALALTVGGTAGLSAAAAATSEHVKTSAARSIPFSGAAVDGGNSPDIIPGGGNSAGGGTLSPGSGANTPGNGSQGGTQGGSGGGTDQGGNGIDGTMPDPGSGPSSGSSSGSGQTDATPASADESTGVVLIDTKLGYEHAEAAGTGVVLSKDGLVLTNNHVIADSTQISVTDATSGKTYEASVVGSDSAKDVAVLKLKDATDLQPATIDKDTASVGDDVTAVGNAGGGGQLQAADGEVTDLGASVTTTAQGTEDSESLNGMIQVDADIVAGDSGGALLDADGEVVGINTAASSGSAQITGFAIPIETALDTADAIIDGKQTSTTTLGYPAFLGIGVEQTGQGAASQNGEANDGANSGGASDGATSGSGSVGQNGAVVAGTYEDTPAAEAGLEAGDTITSIDSTTISGPQQLTEAIADHRPGDTVTVTWTDGSGAAHTAKVTLTEGPAA